MLLPIYDPLSPISAAYLITPTRQVLDPEFIDGNRTERNFACNSVPAAPLQLRMRHTFQAEQWLPFPRDLVFAFFANPQNLPPLMPAWQKARIEEVLFVAPPPRPEGSPARIATGAGTTMVLSFRALPFVPLRIRWNALIPEFVWNDHFCDEQESGPFAYWRHCHSVRPEERDGVDGTVVHDHVTYALPGGPLGDLANALGGRLQMQYIFRTRHQMTAKLMPLYAERARKR